MVLEKWPGVVYVHSAGPRKFGTFAQLFSGLLRPEEQWW
jgi:hypothetical protein